MVDSKVKSVAYEGRDIKHVVVAGGPYSLGGEKIFGDLFIDCMGSKQCSQDRLVSGNPSSILTDRALVFKTDYINREAEMVPYTNAKAMSAGWQWTIPTYDFISRGYVYSSQFQTDDSAWEEFGWDDARLVKFENGSTREHGQVTVCPSDSRLDSSSR